MNHFLLSSLSAVVLLAASQSSAVAAQSTLPVPPVQRRVAAPAIARHWATAWNTRDPEAMARLFTSSGTYEDQAFQVKFEGPAQIVEWVRITGRSIPDARVEILDAFQVGDRVAIQWRFRGTPGTIGALPSTGKTFSVPAVTVLRLDGNRIAHATDYYNLSDLLRQIGLPAGAWTPPLG